MVNQLKNNNYRRNVKTKFVGQFQLIKTLRDLRNLLEICYFWGNLYLNLSTPFTTKIQSNLPI